MGYRSDWKLVVSGNKRGVEKLLDFLSAYSIQGSNKEKGEIARQIYAYKTDSVHTMYNTSKGERGVVFGAENGVCDSPWDDVIAEVFSFCKKTGLDVAYARLGDDMEDYDIRNGKNLSIYYERRLTEVVGLPHAQ